jgi:alpha-L-fucosidase
MAAVANWMKVYRPAVVGATALPNGEQADVPATASGNTRYLFAIPQYKKAERAGDKDMLPLADATMTLRGVVAPKSVKLMRDGNAVEHDYKDGVLTVQLPTSRRTNLPEVVAVELP